jgi:multiple sugar transport system ATP-binding protein
LVFQDYAVFTHMTVKKNLAFGLEVRGAGKSEVKAVVAEAAELLGLGDKLNARASELGGSELQRVAIGRTLVTRPDILLLDEPLSNLETEARLNMRKELRRLQREIGLTIIYVTHDQVEALSLADRIAVMNMGHILQVEDSSLITSRPGHTFVAGFLGSPPMNLLKGHFEHAPDGVRFVRDDFSLPVAPAGAEVPQGQFTLGIRPESIRLAPTGSAGITGRVLLVEPRGPESVVTVAVGRELLKIVIPAAEAHPEEGDQTGLVVDPNALTFFESDHSRRIDLTFAPRTSQ